MRTPNCGCIICDKPLYRRPNELSRVRHVACFAHRAEAQKVSGITECQLQGLSLGREKGTNHRTGYKHKPESKAKASQSHLMLCRNNPDFVKARAEKTRGENHYRWKGGVSRLNTSIRQMTENRRWIDAVKARDCACLRCGSIDRLESHHKLPLADLIAELRIDSREDARRHADRLWDLENGETLCEMCHYTEHGRRRSA